MMGHPSDKWPGMMVQQAVFLRVKFLILLLLALYGLVTDWLTFLPRCTADHFLDSEGPHFISEPSRLNYFTNVQGLLLNCNARGMPNPRMHWIFQKDNQPVDPIPAVRELFPNGTLYFPPFQVSYYRPDIHDQVYICLASNPVGKIRSRDVHVRAVINQQFDVRVESAYTSEGNDALLRCVVPDPVKDFVSVTSWVRDSTLNIFPPHSGGGGRYFMAPSGELLIEDVTKNDSASSFRCRTVNRLTDETQLSENSARLQLKSGPASESPPRILSRIARVKLKEGDVGVVFCLSEGFPPPTQGWLKALPYGQLENVRNSERVRIRQSAIIFESVVAQDAGTYVCVANNSQGSDRYRVEVEVSKPLEVQVVPSVLTVDIGKSAELTCWTNRALQTAGSGAEAAVAKLGKSGTVSDITWRKDGMEIRPTLRTSFSPAGEKLRILTVQREDKGIYQCFVKSDADMAQAAAELRLGDSHPQLIYRFIEQTLRPGTAVSIKCSASGNPTPHITWLLDGFPLPHSERLLIGQYVTMTGDVVSHVNITQTRVEDGGEFQCIATNKLGFATHSARLNIYGAPFVRPMPNTMTAVAGKSFHIKCPVAGYPISGITWQKDEQMLPSTIRQTVSPNGTLTIRDVDRVGDSGWYTCTAVNKQGSSNRRGVHINVVVPPKLAPFSFPESPREGERIFAMCGVSDGDPPIKLQWLKDSVPIHTHSSGHSQGLGSNSSMPGSDISTHQMSDFGVLALQIAHVTWNDTGNYSCIAHNAAGHAVFTLPLVVHVPPKIAPYQFPSPVSQGSRVQVVCSVEQGDIEETNLTVLWLKDGLPLKPAGSTSYVFTTSFPPLSNSVSSSSSSSLSRSSSPFSPSSNFVATNAKVMQVDAYSAILIIERVDAERDSGNYTCRITNAVDDVHKTNELVVRVPPKWVDEPKDSEVVEGKSLRIPCQARGFPTPKISWKRAMSNRPENFRDITQITSSSSLAISTGNNMGYINTPRNPDQISAMGGQQQQNSDPVSYSNGTIFIQTVRKQHHGYYLCEASNGIGSGLSKVVRLVVNVPVRIKEPTENISSPVGANALLKCEISGDPPLLSFGWKKGLDEIKPDFPEFSRYRTQVLNHTGSGSSSGSSSSSSQNNGGTSGGSTSGSGASISSVLQLTVTNVGREDSARYICFAANRHGESQSVVWLHVQEPPDVPRNLHAIAKASRYVRLGWILTQNGNSPLTQFIVEYKQADNPSETQEIRVSGQVFSETVRNLRPATNYVFSVVAENQVGRSQASEPFSIKTDGEAPEGKARNVRVTAVSSSDVQVTWEHPERDTWHGQLLGYYVGYRKYRDGEQYQFSTVEKKEQNMQEFLISGLFPYTPYEIIVQPYNGIGTGPMSEAMLVTTLEDVPSGFPDGIQCTPLTSESLQITWNPVSGDQARGLITGYRVSLEQVDDDYNGDMDNAPLSRSTGTSSLIFNSLAKFTNYSVQVEAFTGVGTGPPSPPIFCHTDEDVPSSPAGIKAIVSSSSAIILSWLPPSQPNGKLTKYNLYISPVSSADGASSSASAMLPTQRRDSVGMRKRTVPADTNKFQFEGLRPDEKYEFRVSASTRLGEGPFLLTQKTQTKNVVSSIISFGQDLRVVWKTDVLLVCDIVGNSIIQWTRFTELVRETDRFSLNRDGSVLIREAKREDSGNYTCTINANGHGVNSITHRLTVQVPPLAPLMTAAGTSFSTVNLQWKLSDSGGALIKGYVLHVKASDEWIEKRLSRHISSYELQGLECGTYYQMYLTAYSRAGMGSASDMVNVSTLGSAPSLKLHLPEFMVQSNRSVTRVLLKDVWSGNGCKIRAFRVFYKAAETSRWQAVGGGEVDGESHSVDLLGLKSSAMYNIRVVAVNSAGTQQTELTITTPSATVQSSGGVGAETSTNVMNHVQPTPFYLDAKLMGPIFIALIALVVVSVSACVCYKRKTPADGQSNENLSVGTPSSSLYFKGNPNHTLHHPQYHPHHHSHHHHPPSHAPPNLPHGQPQMYMTVKKSTPHKGVERTDIETIPHYNTTLLSSEYADDIYPYATFEVNEPPQRDLRACNLVGVPTLDRNRHPPRRASGGQDSIKHHHPHASSSSNMRRDESDEYDSYGSESDYQEEPAYHMPHHSQQQQPVKLRTTTHMGGGAPGIKGSGGLRHVHQKSLEYEPQGRCENRYEFGPQSVAISVAGSQGRNDEIIHGMITSEPYAFNDSYPTALVQDKRGTGKRKSGKRKFHRNNLEAYVSSSEVMSPDKFPLEPPEGFTDTLGNKSGKSGESGGARESDTGNLEKAGGKSTGSGGGGGGGGNRGARGMQQQQVKPGNEYAIAV